MKVKTKKARRPRITTGFACCAAPQPVETGTAIVCQRCGCVIEEAA